MEILERHFNISKLIFCPFFVVLFLLLLSTVHQDNDIIGDT